MHIDYSCLRPKKAEALKELHEHSLVRKEGLTIAHAKNVTLLPIRHFGDEDGMLFGRGGAVDENGAFIEASGIEKRYGGIYEYEAPAMRDECVMYCGYLSFGWGHFLLESVSRLWPVIKEAPQVDRYVFVGNAGGGCAIGGNFGEFLELLGIRDRVELIDAPAAFREVLIPDLSYSFLHYYTEEYGRIFDAVIKAALEGNSGEAAKGKKVFLSRRHVYDKKHWYGGTRPRERGLDMLDDFFSQNDYELVYPERISLRELIRLTSSAECVAVESGSCAHNTLLFPKGTKVQLIERQAYVNDYQANIDVIRDLSVSYVDAHYSLYPVEAFGGPCLLMATPQFLRFAKEKGLTPPPEKYQTPSYYRRAIRWYLWLYRHLMGERIMMDESLLPQAPVFLEAADDTYEAFRPWLDTKSRQRRFKLWERIGYPHF